MAAEAAAAAEMAAMAAGAPPEKPVKRTGVEVASAALAAAELKGKTLSSSDWIAASLPAIFCLTTLRSAERNLTSEQNRRNVDSHGWTSSERVNI